MVTERNCLTCGELLKKKSKEAHWQFAERKFCRRACIRFKRTKDVLSKSTRYHYTKRDGKRIAIHQVIAEEKIGRRLLPCEHVHHLNGIKTDNRPENLDVVDGREHARLHLKQRWKEGDNSLGRKRRFAR